jgi:hypothetical protein
MHESSDVESTATHRAAASALRSCIALATALTLLGCGATDSHSFIANVKKYYPSGTSYSSACDGNTDTAVQNAINAAVKARTIGVPDVSVYFPAGTYCLIRPISNTPYTDPSAPFVPWQDLTFIGDNGGGSIIESNGGGAPIDSGTFLQTHQPLVRIQSLPAVDNSGAAIPNNISFIDLTFVDVDHRCRQLVPGLQPQGTTFVQVASFDNVTMTNVTVHGNADVDGPINAGAAHGGNYCGGIVLTSCHGGTLDNVNVDRMGKGGIYIAGGYGITVKNSSGTWGMNSRFNNVTGIEIAQAQNITLENFTGSNNSNNGIYIVTQVTGPQGPSEGTPVPCSLDSDCQKFNPDYYCVNSTCNAKATNIHINNCTVSGNGTRAALSSGTVTNLGPNVLAQAGFRIDGTAGYTTPCPPMQPCNGQASAPDGISISHLVSTNNYGAGIAINAGTNITFDTVDLEKNGQGGVVINPYAVGDFNPALGNVTVQYGKIYTYAPTGGWPEWPGGPPPGIGLIYPGAALSVLLQGVGTVGPIELKGDPGQGKPLLLDGDYTSMIAVPDEPMTKETLKLTNVNMPVLPNPPTGLPWVDMVDVNTTPPTLTAPLNGLYWLQERRSQALDPNGLLYAPLRSVYTSSTTRWTKQTDGQSNQGWVGQACMGNGVACAQETDCCAGLVCNTATFVCSAGAF